MKKYDWPTHRKGDTFSKIQKFVTSLDLTDATVTIKFRSTSPTGPVALTLTNDDGLTLSGGDTINITPFDVTMSAGIYYWDLQVEFSDGRITTYLYGTWKIVQDTTYV